MRLLQRKVVVKALRAAGHEISSLESQNAHKGVFIQNNTKINRLKIDYVYGAVDLLHTLSYSHHFYC
jgi:uncharacterized transporter YbjL